MVSYKVKTRAEDSHPVLVKDRELPYGEDRISSASQVADMLNSCFSLSAMAEEYLYLIAMDAAGHPLGVFEVSHGTVNSTNASPREIILRTLLCGGLCFVLAHNHPSKNLEPSKDDIRMAKQIAKAAKLMRLTMIDFLIVGDGGFCSFAQNKLY